MDNFSDQIKAFLSENPKYIFLFCLSIGVGGLVCAIIDADWIFGDVNRACYNLKKIDGWVNFFGRKTARVIAGIISILVILTNALAFFLYASLT